MKKLTFLFFLSTTLLFVACGGKQGEDAGSATKEWSALQDEVMAIHDEVMPKMGAINKLSRELKTYLEEHPDLAEEKKAQIAQKIEALGEADEAMMSWMSDYGDLTRQFEAMEPVAIMEALQKEKGNISKVRDAMLSSIEEGTKLQAELSE